MTQPSVDDEEPVIWRPRRTIVVRIVAGLLLAFIALLVAAGVYAWWVGFAL